MKKNSILLLSIFLIIPVLFTIWILNKDTSINEYMEEKYGFKVDIVERGPVHTGNMGSVTHQVAVRGKPELVFGVNAKEDLFLPGMEVVGDEYEIGLQAYEECKKIKPSLTKLKALGIERLNDQQYVSYKKYKDKYVFQLNLKDRHPLKTEMFKGDWVDHYYRLVTEIVSRGTDIEEIHLDIPKHLPIWIGNISSIKTKEALRQEMIRKNEAVSNHYIANQWKDVLSILENERFQFNGNSWSQKDGVKCKVFDEQGVCSDIVFYVNYEEGGLTADNKLLEQDIFHIIEGLNRHLRPETRYGVVLKTATEDGTFFTNEEMKGREDVRNFIEENFQ